MSVFTNAASAAKENRQAYIDALLKLLGDREPVAVLQELADFVDKETGGLSEKILRTPERPGKWSIIEVLQHLADSELVWAYRLRMVLAHDTPEITGYDQDLWAKRLNYRSAKYNDAVAQIKLLRKLNLQLLESLSPEDLRRTGRHKERGEESVAHMIKLYAGHDLVHRNQILRIKA
jgi:uncharacterized damage-inducible protein DinB